jgi:hypothetical protein
MITAGDDSSSDFPSSLSHFRANLTSETPSHVLRPLPDFPAARLGPRAPALAVRRGLARPARRGLLNAVSHRRAI